MKKLLLIGLSFLTLSLLLISIIGEVSYSPNPDVPIFKKETISSWIPCIEKYFMYDRDGKRYKVNKEDYDSYWLWSSEDGIYASDKVAEQLNSQFKGRPGH